MMDVFPLLISGLGANISTLKSCQYVSSSLLTQSLQNGATTAVENFGAGKGGGYGAFKKEVGTPACASTQDELTMLPVLQPNF